ncbi:hypothetical protein PC116_g25158 [Phytophthora cactorum]|uniref:Uncharacterized protein n=1 Tax=Phytophthora cactorum TaxID=29920 RepID=A0A329R794_9STRA|nr:hypothetical protein Pcac1_g10163 [Phytophthora cactorum]KAG2875356.1 hypothetical protein PC114_g24770 [Phytophthora cactorum]KAG2884874.1 hypothetical protein PC117_g25705 [Phytophthora cactorum]KAG2978172.1 hypothetical protein PC120_g25370 [Phytophthora cactorum]KAG3041380.1 hypothetical protein PC119_g723 [Phytophthora cactorum]
MVLEGVASASTTTPHALLLCPLVGWNQGSTFLVTKTIALSPSFAFFLCLTCPVLFVIGAIALTLRLLRSTDTLPLGFYTSSAVSLGGCQVGASGASSLSVSCPSTFLLRGGHGCAPPSSLFSLALPTLPLKFLRPSGILLHRMDNRGVLAGLPDAHRSCFSWRCGL